MVKGNKARNSYAGGLVGEAYDIIITNCYTTGNTTGVYNAGGLIGYNSSNTTITNSYTTGNITGGRDNYTGGLIGDGRNITITNSYTTGDITGSGLVGAGYTITITNCYTTGNNAYGLIGVSIYNPTITNCYITNGTSTYGAIIIGIENLKNGEWIIANLGWDSGIWLFTDGEFPTLK
jgi:hypothetical protein